MLALRAKGRTLGILTAGPISHIGRRSYALYLLPHPLNALTGHAGVSGDTLGTLVGSQLGG